MSERATPAKSLHAGDPAATRALWIAIAAVLLAGLVAIASFGYSALILIALALTLGVFVLLLLIMRG